MSVENLTVCNFLSGNGNAGNEVWWDGAPSESGPLGITGLSGSYLTATSTYYDPSDTGTAAGYGIFSSASAGPAVWNQIYGSNFNDSGMYVGACRQQCDAWIHNAWMEYDPLGYSGTNSGGTLVVSDSQFDNNQDGFDTNTQVASDPPPRRSAPVRATGSAVSPTPPRAGCSRTTSSTTTTTPTCPDRLRRRRTGGHRDDHLGGPRRHHHEQHLRPQRRLGGALRPLPGHRHPAARGHLCGGRGAPTSRRSGWGACSTPRTTPC